MTIKTTFLRVSWLLLFGVFFGVGSLTGETLPEATEKLEETSRFRSDDDGWLDISGFIDQAYGFVPLVIPITEPAVGLGAVGALMFIDKQKEEGDAGFGRPNISTIGALGTDNGTSGVFAGDMRHWRDDHVKTLIGFVHAPVNLDFYGIGFDPLLQDDPQTYNLETTAGMAQVRYRIGESQAWAGLGYVLAKSKVTFDVKPEVESLPNFQSESWVGGLLPHLSFDSRDNMFTPTSGTYLDLSGGLFSEALGSDSDFQRVNLTGIYYQPLGYDLTLGIMGNSILSFGEIPFYMRPFIYLRGVAAMRYQGDYMAQIEAELRWQFWERFSLIGFTGAGVTWNDNRETRAEQNVSTGGVGFRYEIARKYGMHMGLDLAYGPDGPALYVQFGSAWMRP